MLKRKHVLLAAAVAAAAPLAANAATVTYNYGSVTYGTTLSTAGVLSGGLTTVPIVAGHVTIPVGDFFSIVGSVTVTNNANPESGGAYATSSGNAQPANLGLGSFVLGITDSNNAVVAPIGRGTNATATSGKDQSNVAGSNFNAAASAGGTILANGNIGTSPTFSDGIFGTVNSPNAIQPTSTNAGNLSILTVGAGAAATFFNKAFYKVVTAGTSTLTPAFNNSQTTVVFVQTPGTAASAPVYSNRVLTGSDTLVNNMTALVINQAASGQNIISLTSSAPSTYGSNEGTLTVTGGNGSYLPAKIVGLPATGKAFVEGKGFNPATDTEIYGLDVVGASSLTQLIADINTQAGSTIAFAAYPGPGTNPLGAEMNLFLKFTTGLGTGDNFLGFDLTQATTAGNQTATISEVALVPEPASAAGLLIGASGLLMGRRKRKA